MAASGSKQRLVVVGGGAAGFMSAIESARAATAAGVSMDVVVLEATSKCLGKVKISGGGRCNVMHNELKTAKEISDGYPRGKKPLLGPFSRFGPPETAQWFRAEGVKLKTEQDGRMFPITDDSQTIIDALQAAADKAGVTVHTNVRVDGMELCGETGKGKFRVMTSSREERTGPSKDYFCDYVVLATGSSRLAYKWAQALGHDLEDPVPSLFTFNIEDDMLRGLAGLSVQDAEVWIPNPEKPKAVLKQRGPVLVTHSGLSVSAFGARILHATKYATTLKINWTPNIDRGIDGVLEELIACKQSDGAKGINGASGPTLGLPRRLWQALCVRSQLAEDIKWREVKNQDLRSLAQNIAMCTLDVVGKGTFKDEFVTAGGVALSGVDMKKMESKKVPGLFFAGELLDIDGITGGYNFQSAWTTGWTAGRSAAAAAATAASEGN